MALPAEMTVIEMNGFGPAEVMREAKRPMPTLAQGEVLIKVAAAGINRVDVLQRSGAYRPPYGVWDVPGVELAGEIVAIAPESRMRRHFHRDGEVACRSTVRTRVPLAIETDARTVL